MDTNIYLLIQWIGDGWMILKGDFTVYLESGKTIKYIIQFKVSRGLWRYDSSKKFEERFREVHNDQIFQDRRSTLINISIFIDYELFYEINNSNSFAFSFSLFVDTYL